MMKRSFLLSLAAGLVFSFAFATPSQAGTEYLTANFTVTGGTASDIELLYTAPVTAVTVGASTLGPLTPPLWTGDTVTLSFSPLSVGSVDFSVTSTGHLSAYFLTGLSSGVTDSLLHVTIVPEPASFALLGIGMTGLLAFRRLFKRTSAA